MFACFYVYHKELLSSYSSAVYHFMCARVAHLSFHVHTCFASIISCAHVFCIYCTISALQSGVFAIQKLESYAQISAWSLTLCQACIYTFAQHIGTEISTWISRTISSLCTHAHKTRSHTHKHVWTLSHTHAHGPLAPHHTCTQNVFPHQKNHASTHSRRRSLGFPLFTSLPLSVAGGFCWARCLASSSLTSPSPGVWARFWPLSAEWLSCACNNITIMVTCFDHVCRSIL